MKISVTVSGGQQTRDELAKLAENARNLKPAYLRMGVAVLTDAQGRITDGGPGWAPQASGPDGEGNPTGTLLHRNGALFRSLTENAEGNVMQDIPDGLRVGTNLRTPDGKYAIGQLMQDGTGIFGPSGQPIRPTNGKVLSFMVGGRKVFVRSVKGSPKRPFLYISEVGAKKYVSILLQRLRGEF